MKIKNEEFWKKGLTNNTDFYGAEIYNYAERWANLMETFINKGKKLKDIAKETSHEADTNGITGFMYGAAVSVLSEVWEYGEQLRIWHNLGTQIQNEGERANEKGTVLNPALINIEVPN